MKRYFFPLLLVVVLATIFQTADAQVLMYEPDRAEQFWVDSVYNSLSWEQRVGQLIVIRANQPDKPYDERIESYIKRFNLGGICFFKGKAREQLIQTNRWQQLAQTPLFVSIDAEWGLAMRIPGTVSYPLQMTLGAVQDNQLIYEMGKQIAEQCHSLGIHFNFAPVADVNNNAANPVIGVRSFGDNPDLVFEKAMAYANGLKDGKIIATAKHFPGHGDTHIDSHFDLPIIPHSREHLNEVELKPFQKMIAQGVEGIMPSHLYIPALESRHNTPATLSYSILTELLREEMGFKGIVITDGLDMQGVTKGEKVGMVEFKALMAGSDILLLPANVPVAIATIVEAMEEQPEVKARVEESCRRILHYKYKAGLNMYRPINPSGIDNELNKPAYIELKNTLFEAAVTLLVNKENTLPLQVNKTKRAFLTVGQNKISSIHALLDKESLPSTAFQLPKQADKQQYDKLEAALSGMDEIIVSIENTNILAQKNFGIEMEAVRFIEKLAHNKKVTLLVFASPYALDLFKETDQFKAIIIGYQDRVESRQTVAAVLSGKQTAKGSIPVSLKAGFKAGSGIVGKSTSQNEVKPEVPLRKSYELPAHYIRQIDSIVNDGIKKKAYPGCQVVAMLDGSILYEKQYGYLTYDNSQEVTENTIYDLASLTKILASTLAVMKLYENGNLSLDANLGSFFPYLRNSDKAGLKLIDIMTHQSGLDGWIPFHKKLITDNGLDPEVFSTQLSTDFSLRTARNLYIDKNYKYKLFDVIAESKMKAKQYRYSDLGFYFMPDIVELTSNYPFESYLTEKFYRPMGLQHTLFNPLEKFALHDIAPTEDDKLFRNEQLQGTVHDQGAALLGGVSGHAGLFGTAKEVATIMQMLLDKGYYNGMQLLKPETVDYFTTAHFTQKNNRRGIGFDKPPLDPKDKKRSIGMTASMLSYGHTGFTGTLAWADPGNGLVFVFVSNRVFPDADVNRLARLNIRTELHDILNKAVEELKNNGTASK